MQLLKDLIEALSDNGNRPFCAAGNEKSSLPWTGMFWKQQRVFPALGELLPYSGLFTSASINDMWVFDLNEHCWPKYKYSVP